MKSLLRILGPVTAAALMVSGCETILEVSDMFESTGTYGAPVRNTGTYTPDYTTIGTPYDTGGQGGSYQSQSSSAGSTGGSAGTCSSGRPTQCRMPDGSAVICCASPQ